LLPNLCLANYDTGREVTSFLFTTSEVKIETIDSVQRFMIHAHGFKLTNLVDHVQKLPLPYVNIQLRFHDIFIFFINKHDPKILNESNQRVIESNKVHCALIASCKHLRELRLTFWDRFYLLPTWGSSKGSKQWHGPIVIDEQFDIQSVLGCKELQKVCILGVAHWGPNTMIEEYVNLRLRGTREIGRGIRERFGTLGRKVEVRVYLHYHDDDKIDLQEGEEENIVDGRCVITDCCPE
jgi:hypothetical protein